MRKHIIIKVPDWQDPNDWHETHPRRKTILFSFNSVLKDRKVELGNLRALQEDEEDYLFNNFTRKHVCR